MSGAGGWPPGASAPLRFDRFMEAALYDAEHGFYASGAGSAGRRGDFLTSVEVGPLFAAVLAEAIDGWWAELGRPSGFTVVDAGAGAGTLARGLVAARPAWLATGRIVMVERSAQLRARQPVGDGLASASDLPAGPFDGVIVANELLDNLPFRLLERTTPGWSELWVTPAGPQLRPLSAAEEADLQVSLRRGAAGDGAAEAGIPVGGRVPWQVDAAAWTNRALRRLRRGRLVVFDYAATSAELAQRGQDHWLRTYRGHSRGGGPLDAPGTQDITCDVALDQLPGGARVSPQADVLTAWGIDGLVEAGRRTWRERAHLADLAALRARSRVAEAEALLDRDGLGGFTVLEWAVGNPSPAAPPPEGSCA